MNEQEVRQQIQNGESSKVEFKSEDVHPVSLAEEIVAFANFEGGTIQEILRLFQRKNLLQFDETPVLKAGIESIDLNKVDTYLKKQGLSLLNQEEPSELINDLLNLSIIVDIDSNFYPVLGAMLAFGKRPQHYYPSYTILCGAYGAMMLCRRFSEKKSCMVLLMSLSKMLWPF